MATVGDNRKVWMLGKNTILKAIHNRSQVKCMSGLVWMLGKNTILKAIHNKIVIDEEIVAGVNAG